MSSFLQRMRWRLAMSCGRPRLEHFVILIGLSCAAIILLSFFIYERHADVSSAVEQRRRNLENGIEDYVLNYHERKAAAQMEMLEKAKIEKKKQYNVGLHEEEPNNVNQTEELLRIPEPKHISDDDVFQNLDKEESAVNNHKMFELDNHQKQFVNNSLLNRRRAVMVALGNVRLKAFNDTASNTSLPRRKKVGRRRKVKVNEERLLGELQGGEAHVKVYSAYPDEKEQFECLKLNIKPLTMVCLHDLDVDVHVSQHIHDVGIWEPYIVRMYQNLLFTEPDLGVYDIGSHIGQYTLLAAVMGHKVVAVDPYVPNLVRIRRAMKLNNLTSDQIILVQNAISDERETYELSIPSDNQGGTHLSDQDADRFCTEASCPPHAQTIFMDDLLEVTNFKRAIIKIDIEGHEHRAFAQSAKLFQDVRILYIFMEWIKLRGYYGSEADDSQDKRLVFGLIETLTGRGYTACGLVLLNPLDPVYWYGWPDDIVWQHKDAKFV